MARHKRTFATIERLPSKRWRVKYTVAGVRVSAPFTFDSRLVAEAWVANRRREIDRGKIEAAPERITFAVYAARWLANRQTGGRPLKARTQAHYSAILRDYLLPTFGPLQLSQISPRHVREWYAGTLADKPTMRSHAYRLLKSVMASAVVDELIDANPCRIVGASRPKRVHQIRPASIEELALLTEAMPKRLRLMVTLASWCALRFGETVELRRRDIDLSDEVIRIRRAAVRIKGTYSVTTPKSDAGIRDVAIPPHIIPQIKAHLAEHVGPYRDSLLFPAANGGHLQPSMLYGYWYEARNAVGRNDLRWHDLRHSGAVLAAATGATLAELMARLGHSSPAAALRYQHAAQGRDRQIAALLSKLAEGS